MGAGWADAHIAQASNASRMNALVPNKRLNFNFIAGASIGQSAAGDKISTRHSFRPQ